MPMDSFHPQLMYEGIMPYTTNLALIAVDSDPPTSTLEYKESFKYLQQGVKAEANYIMQGD